MPIVRRTDRYDATVHVGFPVIVCGAASVDETATPLRRPIVLALISLKEPSGEIVNPWHDKLAT